MVDIVDIQVVSTLHMPMVDIEGLIMVKHLVFEFSNLLELFRTNCFLKSALVGLSNW